MPVSTNDEHTFHAELFYASLTCPAPSPTTSGFTLTSMAPMPLRTRKFLAHFLLAPKVSSFFLSFSAIVSAADKRFLTSRPNDVINPRVTGVEFFWASSTKAKTRLSIYTGYARKQGSVQQE